MMKQASNRLFELSKEEIQLGLVEFIDKQKKLKQLELVTAMNQAQDSSNKRASVVSSSTSTRPTATNPTSSRAAGLSSAMPASPVSKPHEGQTYSAPTSDSPSAIQTPRQHERMAPSSLHSPSLDIIVD